MNTPMPPQLTLHYEAQEQAASITVEPKGVTIGRKADCDIVLQSSDVSRQHAQIRAERGCWILRDLGSSNGTLIEGMRIKEHELRDGDSIHIGGFEIRCRLGGLHVRPDHRLENESFPLGKLRKRHKFNITKDFSPTPSPPPTRRVSATPTG